MAYVQSVTAAATGATAPVLNGVAAGNALYAIVYAYNAAQTGLTVSSSNGGAFTQVGSNTASGVNTASIWKLENVASGTHTVTCTPTPGTLQLGVGLFEVTSTAASTNEGTSGNVQVAPGTTANAITSGNFTTSGNGDLLLTATSEFVNGFTTAVAGSNLTYTSLARQPYGTGGSLLLAYATQASAGSVAGDFTDATNGSNGSTSYMTIAVAIKAPGAGGVVLMGKQRYVMP